MPLAALIPALESNIPDQDDPEFVQYRTILAGEDSEGYAPPRPPSALQDDDLERWIAATQFIVDDGQESFLVPTPPLAIQPDMDSQGVYESRTWSAEDLGGAVFPPVPPVPLEAWDEQEAYVTMTSGMFQGIDAETLRSLIQMGFVIWISTDLD